ncbi:MAG TPA: Crp/Fnr family transcriptional regulator [Pseudonocardia sp.]|jgi:CRP-like cAMP-binding protein|nr:Crp/Fnr family transcriptional regulator [Pseudonocardia sp.]
MDAGADNGAAHADFLTSLDATSRETLYRRGRVQCYRAGAMLLYEGQLEAPVVVLVEGLVRVTALAADGRELVLAFRGAGSILGELAALEGGKCSATVAAIEDVRAISLPPEQFHEFLRERPDAAIALLRLIAHRLRDSDRKRLEFATLDTTSRVAARIVELADRFGQLQPDGSIVVALTLSQEALAGWVGGSREATVRALTQLRTLGLVETGRRRIRVRDLEALRRRSLS